MRYNQALGFYEESYLSVDAEGGNSPSKQRFVVPCGAPVNVSRGRSVFPKCDKYCKNKMGRRHCICSTTDGSYSTINKCSDPPFL